MPQIVAPAERERAIKAEGERKEQWRKKSGKRGRQGRLPDNNSCLPSQSVAR